MSSDESENSAESQHAKEEHENQEQKSKSKPKRRARSQSAKKEKPKRKPKKVESQHEQESQEQQNQNQPEQKQKVAESEMFMLKEQRELDKNHPRYHFCRFISRHYRLIENKKDRKHHFMRMQPIFVRFLHILKDNNLPLITIDVFRKYFKKFYKRRGIKYQETFNNSEMKVVVGIDRRHNSKFGF